MTFRIFCSVAAVAIEGIRRFLEYMCSRFPGTLKMFVYILYVNVEELALYVFQNRGKQVIGWTTGKKFSTDYADDAD